MTSDNLEELAKRVEQMRVNMLFDFDEKTLGPMSEQFFLLALVALEAAYRNLTIAKYHQMRGD